MFGQCAATVFLSPDGGRKCLSFSSIVSTRSAIVESKWRLTMPGAGEKKTIQRKLSHVKLTWDTIRKIVPFTIEVYFE
jgi:hypothetical protein